MTNTKNWEKEFDKFWELQFPNSHPAEYGVVKKFISSLLSHRDAEVVEMVERVKVFTNDLKTGERCTYYTDHTPCWDGNFYTCSKCGQEFIKAKEINKVLDDILAALKEQTKKQ